MSETLVETSLKITASVQALRHSLKAAFKIAIKGLKEHNDYNKIALEAKAGELVASSFGGRVAAIISSSDLNWPNLGYVCNEEGKVTLNATDFQKSLESFPDSDRITIVADENSVTIAKENDADEQQQLPLLKEEVLMPELATSFVKEVKISNKIFVAGIKNTLWACGFEDLKETYHHIRLQVSKKHAQFVAGTGGRFKGWEADGDNIVDTIKKTEFLLHKEQVSIVESILDDCEDDDIVIKQAEQSDECPDQIIIQTSTATMMFVGLNVDLGYPAIEKKIAEKRAYSLQTKVADWEFATKGLMATFNEDVKRDHDTHESDLEAKIDKKYIQLTATSGMKSQRKIPILEVNRKGKASDGVELHCSTAFVAEVYNRCPRNDVVAFEYSDDVEQPVFIFGPENKSVDDITTKYFIFFVSMKK